MTRLDEPTVEEVYKRGLEALSRELGPVGMVRFIQMFEPGKGDYVKDREKLLNSISRTDLAAEIERQSARIRSQTK